MSEQHDETPFVVRCETCQTALGNSADAITQYAKETCPICGKECCFNCFGHYMEPCERCFQQNRQVKPYAPLERFYCKEHMKQYPEREGYYCPKCQPIEEAGIEDERAEMLSA